MIVSSLHFHPYAEFGVQVSGDVFARVDRAVLSAGAAEADGQVGEAPFQVTVYMSVHQSVHMFQEAGDFPIVFQEADDRFVASGE